MTLCHVGKQQSPRIAFIRIGNASRMPSGGNCICSVTKHSSLDCKEIVIVPQPKCYFKEGILFHCSCQEKNLCNYYDGKIQRIYKASANDCVCQSVKSWKRLGLLLNHCRVAEKQKGQFTHACIDPVPTVIHIYKQPFHTYLQQEKGMDLWMLPQISFNRS